MKAPYLHLYTISTFLAVGAIVWKYLNPNVPVWLIVYPVSAIIYALMNQLLVALCQKKNLSERQIQNILWIEFFITVLLAIVVGFLQHWLACYMLITLPIIDWSYRYGYQWMMTKAKQREEK